MVLNPNILRVWLGGIFNTILEALKKTPNLSILPQGSPASARVGLYEALCIPNPPLILSQTIHRHGASADVYMGQLQGKKVAVKKFRIWVTKKEDMKKQFRKEVDILRRLGRHENIIQLLGVSQVDGIPSIIMPWMEQGCLYDILRLKPPKMARDLWVIGITHGMLFLKTSAVVHGDLKSANILINCDGTARIADFGLSRRVSPVSSSRFAFKTERFLSLFRSPKVEDDWSLSVLGAGSSRWAAPEILHPEKWGKSHPETTFESDVFALAMVFYEIYSSKLPFHYQNDYMAMISIIKDRRPKRPQLMTDQLWDLTTVCWHPNASFRPPIEVIHEELTNTSKRPQHFENLSAKSNVDETKE